MNIKKITSLLIALTLVCTAVLGSFTLTASAATITYSYVITTAEQVNAIDGQINYPADSLSVQSVELFDSTCAQSSSESGIILFNTTKADAQYDFSQGCAVITVVFEVNGAYDVSDIYGEMVEIYSVAGIASGNIPFDYADVVNGETVALGYVDIDNPENSYIGAGPARYTVVYSYKEDPQSENSVYTKKVKSWSEEAQDIASEGMPRIENPYYKNYSVESAEFAGAAQIYANLTCEDKKYSVYVNGKLKDEYGYLELAEIKEDEEKDFLINGQVVASGEEYKFFVAGDTNITVEEKSGTVKNRAVIIKNALSVCDNPEAEGEALVKMEFLASAVTSDFARMGVAIAATDRSEADLTTAITAITEGTSNTNKIIVHNTSLSEPNVTGQYQFLYAPYTSVSKVNRYRKLFFYAYYVTSNGEVKISDYSKIDFANVLA